MADLTHVWLLRRYRCGCTGPVPTMRALSSRMSDVLHSIDPGCTCRTRFSMWANTDPAWYPARAIAESRAEVRGQVPLLVPDRQTLEKFILLHGLPLACHRQSRISGGSSPCSTMYCRCAASFSVIALRTRGASCSSPGTRLTSRWIRVG